MINFEKISDQISRDLGSTKSAIIHTLVFLIFILLYIGGDDRDKANIMLILTTIVSLEAIYLSIFIQRSTNKQSDRLEKAIKEIRFNTVSHLEEPLDLVVKDIQEKVSETAEIINNEPQSKKK